RLHELFLDLVIDPVDEFAFTRKIVTDEIEAPAAVRSERLTFLDTAMLLVLRQLLLAAPGEKRVIVDREEVYERLAIYRTGDESTFQRNLNGSWSRMSNRLRVLHKAGEDRFEISPMVKFLIDEDRVRELIDVYERIASGQPDAGEADAPEETTGEEEAWPRRSSRSIPRSSPIRRVPAGRTDPMWAASGGCRRSRSRTGAPSTPISTASPSPTRATSSPDRPDRANPRSSTASPRS